MANEVGKKKQLHEQLEPLIERAISILEQALNGKPTNSEVVKNAKMVLQTYKGSLVVDKENRRVNMMERRFNLGVLEQFGSPEQKSLVKKAIQDALPKMKFLE